ncbi:helix-turn-helix domain-containing protein [Bradyrhizobium roseum]|uniref:helix-turn-helix domain-containing protein n=1 Tax=Bradyrhizobium roseum TaxID=3056648 RepID=UPI002A4E2A9F|nr:transcriptional regulator [Bradyrhizobium roseus]
MTLQRESILTEADYKNALLEAERLWGAKSGTTQGDRLDALAGMIDAYEAKQYPVAPPDPISAIQFRMEQQGSDRSSDERSDIRGKL